MTTASPALARRPGRVLIVSGFELTANPRVVKEADALHEAGHDVTVLGAIHSDRAKARISALLEGKGWRHFPVFDRTDKRLVAQSRHAAARIRARLAREAKRRLGVDHAALISPVTGALERAALAYSSDLAILHLEPALLVGARLVAQGRRIAIDIEDWYSEDGLPEDRSHRPIALMKRCEATLLNAAAYSTTTSDALADGLASAYACPRPSVVYNSFPSEGRSAIDGVMRDRKNRATPSVFWFSQTIGPGRGLEELVDAMAHAACPFELHLRGSARPGYLDELRARATEHTRNWIHVHPQVPQAELLSRIAEHDIGYCGELPDCASRDLTITNKMFEYMRGRLAIVATSTAGQREVAAKAPGAIRIVDRDDPRSIAAALNGWLTDPAALEGAKSAALECLTAHFDWSRSKETVQSLVDHALSAPQQAAS